MASQHDLTPEDESRQDRGPLSPFAIHRSSSDIVETLSLSACRKVSVVIKVEVPSDDDRLSLFPVVSADSKQSSPKASTIADTLDAYAQTQNSRDLIVVNPTAFGKWIPSQLTMETARLVAQVANIPSEDWARLYRFQQIVWPRQTQPLEHIIRAIVQDSTTPGSISCRTIVGMGAQPTKTLFGCVSNKSVAQVFAKPPSDNFDTVDVLENYGLLGLTIAKLQLYSVTALTLSLLEIQDDHLHDLQATRPFDPLKRVQLRYEGGKLPVLVGLSDVPVDGLKGLGLLLRRSFAAANHKRRPAPRGHILATLKIWQHNVEEEVGVNKCTVVHFLDVAHVAQNELGGSDPDRTARRNASVRQSLTALGSVLRGALLKEAGNDAMISFRESTLTKVLQRAVDHPDARLVVVASVSPCSSAYEQTMSTLRYVNRLLYRQASTQALFDDDGKETSPTSPETASDDASLSLDQMDGSTLLQNMLSDPRQRLAKVLKPRSSTSSKRRRPQPVVTNAETMDDEHPYVPTPYMEVDPGEFWQRRESPSAAKTPLVRNHQPSQSSSPQLDEHMLKKYTVDTSFALDSMEKGDDYDEPSPLTADTGSFLGANHLVGRMLESSRVSQVWATTGSHASSLGSVPKLEDDVEGWNEGSANDFRKYDYYPKETAGDGTDQGIARTYTQEMDDLSLELMQKTGTFNQSLIQDEGSYTARPVEHEMSADLERQIQNLQYQIERSELIISERTNAEVAAREAQFEVEREAERRKQLLDQREAEITRLQAELERIEQQRHAWEDMKAELWLEREQLNTELIRAKKSLESELESRHREMKKRDDEIKKLKVDFDEAKQSECSSDEEFAEIIAERERLRAQLLLLQEELALEKRLHFEDVQRLESDAAKAVAALEECHLKQSSHNQLVDDLTSKRLDLENKLSHVNQERLLETSGSQRELQLKDHQISQLQKYVENLKQQFQTKHDETVRELEEVKKGALTTKIELEEELQCLSLEIDRRDATISDLKSAERKRLELEHSHLDAMEKVNSDRFQAEAVLKKEKEELELATERLRFELERREDDVQRLESSLNEANQHFQRRLDCALVDLTSERDNLKTALQSVRNRCDNLQRDTEHLNDEAMHSRIALGEAQRDKQLLAAKVNTLEAELARAQNGIKILEEKVESEATRYKRLLQRKDKDIIDLEEGAERSRRQLAQSQEQTVAELLVERDAAEKKALWTQQDLDHAEERHLNEVNLLEETIRNLNAKLVDSATHLEQEHLSTFNEVLDENKTLKSRFELAQQAFDSEMKEQEVEKAKLREHSERVLASLKELEHREKSLQSTIVDLTDDYERAKQETAAIKREVHLERQRHQREVQRKDGEISMLEELMERSKKQLLLSQEETVATLVAERDQAEKAALRAEQDLSLASERHHREIERLREEISELQIALQASKYQTQLGVEAMTETQTLKHQLRSVEQSTNREIERMCREIGSRDEQIRDLRSTLDRSKQAESQLLELRSERDAAVEESRHLKAKFASDVEEQRRVVYNLEATIEQLRESLEREKEKSRQSKDEAVTSILAELQLVEAKAAEANRKHHLETERFMRDLESRDEDIVLLQTKLEEVQVQYKQAQMDSLALLQTEREKAEQETSRIRTELDDIDKAHHFELDEKRKLIETLQIAVEKANNERAEALKIADDSISIQQELENRISELEGKLALQASLSVPKDKYTELKAANADLIKELHEMRTEIFQYKTEITEEKMIKSELQFALGTAEKEKSRLMAKEIEYEQEIDGLRAQVRAAHAADFDMDKLRNEISRLKRELDASQGAIAEHQSEAEQHQRAIDELRAALSAQCEETRLAADTGQQEVVSLQEHLVELEKALARAEAYNIEKEYVLAAEKETQDTLTQELEQTRYNLSNRLEDIRELSISLKQAITEKEESEMTKESMKAALTIFRDETRARVEKLQIQKNETMSLLERTLEENQALATQNQELRTSLDDILSTRLKTYATQRDEAFSEMDEMRAKNQSLVEAIEQLQRRLHEQKSSEDQSLHQHAAWSNEASLLLERTLREKEALADANQKLKRSLGEKPATHDPNPQRLFVRQNQPSAQSIRHSTEQLIPPPTTPPFPSMGLDAQSRADEIAAYIALSAKKTVEATAARTANLQNQFALLEETKQAEIDRLHIRVRALESQLGSTESFRVSVDDKDAAIEALNTRVRALERRLVQADRGRVYLRDPDTRFRHGEWYD